MHVTPDGHAAVAARTESLAEAETVEGWGFVISTPVISLTNASTENALVWIKNTSENDTYLVTHIELALGNSTSGTGDGTAKILRKPDAGTVVSDESAATSSNRNFGQSKSLLGLFYAASAAGKTLTGGTVHETELLASPAGIHELLHESIALEPGSSFGVSWTTQASNSAQSAIVTVDIHKLTLGT